MKKFITLVIILSIAAAFVYKPIKAKIEYIEECNLIIEVYGQEFFDNMICKEPFAVKLQAVGALAHKCYDDIDACGEILDRINNRDNGLYIEHEIGVSDEMKDNLKAWDNHVESIPEDVMPDIN
jgi:hypothetical protein